jgi:malonate-semialdehyde dehydrogenase (acetylating) / methylmalonate-semialdehyde dehydrogenase
MTDLATRPVRDFVGGTFRDAAAGDRLLVRDPATGEPIAATPLGGRAELDRAVAAGRAAFPAWAATPVPARVQVLFRLKQLMEENFDELSRRVTRENGKSRGDAEGEVRRGIEVVEFACGMPTLMMGEASRQIAGGVDNVSHRFPLGVVAAITPFNFPCMVPMWTLPIAIGAGNSYVLKPSEKTPLTAQLLVELLAEAGLPDGVVGLVNGGRAMVDAILGHPDIAAVSFVGSQPVAEHVYRTAAAHGKRVQALAGAKNSLIVMPDAVLGRAVDNIIGSAFGNAGERCLAGSVVVAVGEVAEPLVERLVAAARALRMGPGSEGGELTPLIDADHLARVREYIELGLGEGAEAVLDGRQLGGNRDGFFLGATILDRVDGSMRVAREEIFGPVLSIVRVPTLDAAIEFSNESTFGNAATIYTESGPAARVFRERIEAGMLGVNVGVAAPMAFFPFNGVKRSFYGDLHATGKDGVRFFTENKVEVTRWYGDPGHVGLAGAESGLS